MYQVIVSDSMYGIASVTIIEVQPDDKDIILSQAYWTHSAFPECQPTNQIQNQNLLYHFYILHQLSFI